MGDALEINGLVVYNGLLYGGSIPHSEVFRYDEGVKWTSVGRFLDPAGYPFKDTNEWLRVTLFRVRRQLRDCIEAKLAGGRHAL